MFSAVAAKSGIKRPFWKASKETLKNFYQKIIIMRRPFRKIFAFSLGIMLFFLVAKVFVAALFLAALISIPYLFFRGLRSALVGDHYRPREYGYNLPNGYSEDEPLFYSDKPRSRNQYERRPDYRFVEVS